MSQLSIFDLPSGIRGRDEGIARIVDTCETYVETARGVARILARRRGVVSSDDVREVLTEYGIEAPHPNAIGAIFKGKEWHPVGWMQSKIPSNHGRVVRSWSLRGV